MAEFFERHSQIFDDSASQFFEQGQLPVVRPDPETAVSELQKAASYNKLGDIYLLEKNPERALDMFDRVISLHAGSSNLALIDQVVCAQLHRTIAQEQQSKLHDALEALELLSASHSQNKETAIMNHVVTAKLRSAQIYVKLQLRHKALRVVQSVIKTYQGTGNQTTRELVSRALGMQDKLRPTNH